MAQIDNKFTAFFMDTTSAPGTPLTSLTPTITIREATSPYTEVVSAESMTNMGGGHYIYVFSGMVITKEYTYTCNPGATAFIQSGVTQNSLFKWIEDNRSTGGGGGFVNLSGVTGSINNLTKLVKEENISIKKHITDGLNETNSYIDIAKGDISDKIESIEIPEAILEEKEAKKALKIVTSIDKKLSSYIESEMNEKSEISELTAEFTRQEIEDRKKEKMEKEEEKRKEEEEKVKEEEMDKKLLEELSQEFDKQEEMDKEEKRKELEQELQELEKEKKEIEKELKTL